MSSLQPSSSSAAASKRSSVAHAAVAEKMSGSAFSQFAQPAGKGMGFYTGEDGYMYCDNLRVNDIRQQVRGGHMHALLT
jgi:diaminopimelate decarboxylase